MGKGAPPLGVFGVVIARNALLNLTALGLPLIVAFLTLPVMIRGLGNEQFGVLAILWMMLAYLSDLGFGATSTRYAAEAIGAGRTEDLSAIAWRTGSLQVTVGLVEGLALALLTPWLIKSVFHASPDVARDARACLFLLAASIPLLGLARSFRGLTEAAQRFDLALMVHLPITVATYVVASAGAATGWSLFAVFAVIVGFKLVSIPAYFMASRHALPGLVFKPVDRGAGWRELTTFTGWLTVSALVAPLLLSVDRFMLGALVSMAAVTYYAAPYEIVSRLVLIPAGIVGALYPAFSHLSGQRDPHQTESLAARATNLILVLLGPLVIVILAGAHDGLTLWLGAEYASRSGLAVQILAIGVLVNAAAHVPYGLLQGTGRPDVPARINLLELPIHIAVAWILINRFGIPGAAMAWTARMLLDAGLLFFAAARMKVLRLSALHESNLTVTLAILTVAGCAAVSVAAFLDSLVGRIAAATVFGCVTAGVLWWVAVPGPERRRITAFLRPGA